MSTSPSGFRNPWDTGSRLYRRLLMTGMSAIGIGVLLAVIGAVSSVMLISWTAIGLIGVGVVVHVFAQVIRFRDARRRQ